MAHKFSTELFVSKDEILKIFNCDSYEKGILPVENSRYRSVMEFCEKFGVNPDEIISGDFDMERIRSFNSIEFSNDKYLTHKGTFVGNVRTSLEVLACKYNLESVESVLNSIGVSRKHLSDETQVSIDFANDVFEIMVSKFKFDNFDIYNCSLNSYTTSKRRLLKENLSKTKSEIELVKKVCELSSLYENNFNYSVQESKNEIKVISVATEQAHDAYRRKIISSYPITLYKAGVFMNTPTALDRPRLKLVKINDYYSAGRQRTEYIFKKNMLSNFGFLQ